MDNTSPMDPKLEEHSWWTNKKAISFLSICEIIAYSFRFSAFPFLHPFRRLEILRYLSQQKYNPFSDPPKNRFQSYLMKSYKNFWWKCKMLFDVWVRRKVLEEIVVEFFWDGFKKSRVNCGALEYVVTGGGGAVYLFGKPNFCAPLPFKYFFNSFTDV